MIKILQPTLYHGLYCPVNELFLPSQETYGNFGSGILRVIQYPASIVRNNDPAVIVCQHAVFHQHIVYGFQMVGKIGYAPVFHIEQARYLAGLVDLHPLALDEPPALELILFVLLTG